MDGKQLIEACELFRSTEKGRLALPQAGDIPAPATSTNVDELTAAVSGIFNSTEIRRNVNTSNTAKG